MKKKRGTAMYPKKQSQEPMKVMVDEPKRDERPDEQGRMDFGGIPNRDLKKNLGCG